MFVVSKLIETFKAHKLSKLMEFLCLGGITILFFLFWNTFNPSTPYVLNFSTLTIYSIAGVTAFFIYQPHLLISYFVNYSKDKNFLKEHFVTFILAPLLMVIVAIMVFIDVLYYEFIPNWLYQSFLALALIFISWHFSCQSVNSIFYNSSKLNILNSHSIMIKSSRVLFFLTFLFAIFSCSVELGSYPFYGLPTVSTNFDTSLLKAGRIIFLVSHGFLYLFTRSRLSLLSSISWIAFLLWTLTVTFTKNFFYLVPLMHGIEVIPYYLKLLNAKRINKKMHITKLILSSLFIFGVVLQLIILFEKTFSIGKYNYSKLFIFILICLNIHHAISERYTWKR